MKASRKILVLCAISMILLPTFGQISIISPVLAQSKARLTGRIFDHTIDTDADSLSNYLLVDVEVEVYESGTFEVGIDALESSTYLQLYVDVRNESYLKAGVQNVSLAINGIAIFGDKLDPAFVQSVSLSYWEDSMQHFREEIYELPLSRIYLHTEFDTGAFFTGVIVDEGVDTGSDGFFNYLDLGIELNVTDEATYQVSVNGLYEVAGYSYKYVYASNSTSDTLFEGVQLINISLYGPPIYASHGINISLVSSVSLYLFEEYKLYSLDNFYDEPLTRAYSYDEFETPVRLTGTIFDEAVDSDADSLFEYLIITVEINVTEAGEYEVRIVDLTDNASEHIYVWESTWDYFEIGVHLVNVTIYGPDIHLSGLNPAYVAYVRVGGGWDFDRFYDLPLLGTYDFNDFDPHAVFVGSVSDVGVDSDGDSLYDYLSIGIGINVTEAGMYRISIDKLLETVNGSIVDQLYAYEAVEDYFGVGNYTIQFNYSGSMFTYERFSPTDISSVLLAQTSYPYMQLGYMESSPLSQRYDYTSFESPMNDVRVDFTVYPNASIELSASTNWTNIYPAADDPRFNVTVGFSTNGNVTTGAATGGMTFPSYVVEQWPFNYTSGEFLASVQNGMLDAQFNVSLLMPPEGLEACPINSTSGDFSLTADYANGVVDVHLTGIGALCPLVASGFPFNVSDLTLLVDYADNMYSGIVVLRVAGGFPLAELVADLEGNETDIKLTGSVDVAYTNLFGDPIAEENVTQYLSFLTNLTGTDEQSLYNLTDGIIEFASFNATRTPETWGETVDYEAILRGNLTGALARLISEMFGETEEMEQLMAYAGMSSAFSSIQNGTLQFNYYNSSKVFDLELTLFSDAKEFWNKAVQLVPSAAPEEVRAYVEAMVHIGNATAYATENAHVQAEYIGADQKLNLAVWLTANVTELKEEVFELAPQAAAPELQPIIESFLNVSYCELDSLTLAGNFTDGAALFDAEWVLQGDFKRHVNHVKRFYIDYLNATSPYMIDWSMRLLNATEINGNNFALDLRQGEDWMTMSLTGLSIDPLVDEVDPVRFTLYRWMNMTNDPSAPPQQFEKLNITINGGFNGTHTVLLHAAPGMVPSHIQSLDYKTMNWENTSVSDLRNLIFQVAYQGVIDYLGTIYYVPVFTNSTVSDFDFSPGLKQIHFNVSAASGTGFCNMTIPRALLYADPAEWIVRVDGQALTAGEFSVTENAEYAFIYLNYTHSEHLIVVEGTTVVSELLPLVNLLVLVVLALAAAIVAFKQRRRLKLLRTKCQDAVYAFTAWLQKPKN